MEGPEGRNGEGTSGGAAGGGDIGRMPEECICLVLAMTTPRDVCRSSVVSSAFLSAGESDIVWDRLLPPDYREILLYRSSTPVTVSSKRELYFHLCDSILIDGGSKMLWLEKATGKKCYMLSARALGIAWGDDARYWTWISVPGARFPEVAKLLIVCWLEIRASISSRDLSPGTRYGAYLVMRLAVSSYGLEDPPQEAVVSVGEVPSSTRRVRLKERLRVNYHRREALVGGPPPPPDGGEVVWVPRARGDGWMELEMGDFVVEAGGQEWVEVRLKGWQSLHGKSGLIVHGLELRPMP